MNVHLFIVLLCLIIMLTSSLSTFSCMFWQKISRLKIFGIFSESASYVHLKPDFNSFMWCLVILDTHIFEISVTIPGIKYVIDPGLVKAWITCLYICANLVHPGYKFSFNSLTYSYSSLRAIAFYRRILVFIPILKSLCYSLHSLEWRL